MATITKRSPGRWQAKIRKKGYRVQSKTFSTKARAERWATIVESDMERSVFVDSSSSDRTLFDDVARRYLSEVLRRQKSIYEAPFRLSRLRTVFGDIGLSAISPQMVSTYRDERLGEVSPASVRKELLLLRRVIEQATREWGFHLPLGNPVSRVRLPKDSSQRERRLIGQEEDTLLVAAQQYGGEIYEIIVFAVETAARRSEIAALSWGDVDLDNNQAMLRDTKNGESRMIPLSAPARSLLKKRARHVSGTIFSLKPASISQAFKRVCIKAGIPDLRFHDLRHEATSRFFEQGLSLMEVACITGHKDLAMLRRYTHMKASDLAKRMDRLRTNLK